jgi:hypothetical protein
LSTGIQTIKHLREKIKVLSAPLDPEKKVAEREIKVMIF